MLNDLELGAVMNDLEFGAVLIDLELGAVLQVLQLLMHPDENRNFKSLRKVHPDLSR